MVDRTIAINKAKSFISECEKNGLTFHKVMLFGSAATDQMHEWSDIDLLLVSDQFTENIFENLKLYSKINIKYPSIETHPFSTKSYTDGNEFIEEIKNNCIELETIKNVEVS